MARAAIPGVSSYTARFRGMVVAAASARTACRGVVLSMARVLYSGIVGGSAHACTLGIAWVTVRVLTEGVTRKSARIPSSGVVSALAHCVCRGVFPMSVRVGHLAFLPTVGSFVLHGCRCGRRLAYWRWVCAEALARVAGSDVATLLARVVVHGGRLGSSSRRGHGDREGVGSRNIIGRLVSSGSLRS